MKTRELRETLRVVLAIAAFALCCAPRASALDSRNRIRADVRPDAGHSGIRPAAAPRAAALPSGLPTVVLTHLPGSLSSPVHVTNAHDGSGRLFVVEQTGQIRSYSATGRPRDAFLDVSSLINPTAASGPAVGRVPSELPSNGFFYVYYINNCQPRRHHDRALHGLGRRSNVADPTRRRSCWSSRTPPTPTTTAASSSSDPTTATSTSARATEDPAAIPRTTRRTST